jgi:hypothetical protein
MMRPRWLGHLAAPVLSWPVVALARTGGEKGRRRGREGERGWQRHGSGLRAVLTASQPTPGLHRFERCWHLSRAAPKWPSGPSRRGGADLAVAAPEWRAGAARATSRRRRREGGERVADGTLGKRREGGGGGRGLRQRGLREQHGEEDPGRGVATTRG